MKIALLFILSFIRVYASSSQLEELLSRYQRPFTMMAIGKDLEIILEISGRFPKSVFIIANSQVSDPLPNVIVLSKELNVGDLEIFGECENLDVAYIPDINQVAAEDGNKRIRTIEKLAHYALVSNQNSEPLTLLQSEKNYILRKSWERGLHSEPSHRVHADFKEKKLLKSNKALSGKIVITDWQPGINLITFKMLKGSYPTENMIIKELEFLRQTPHNDWVINNMILRGTRIILIDFDDPRRGEVGFCSDELFEKHIEIIKIDDPNEIEKLLRIGLK